MLPSFLITFREVIEASLIVATILGILIKLNHKKSIKTVWYATLFAILLSLVLLGLGSLFGLKVQELYSGKTEELIEGILMITSSIFITWAVFFLHKYFAKYKVLLIKKIKKSLEGKEQKGLFALTFTAVFREGFEIVLFLSTIYFSSNPQSIFIGFSGGLLAGLLVSLALFGATLKLPVYLAFRTTSALLILFAAGLLARGVHEFAEAGIVPELTKFTFNFLPEATTFSGQMIKAVFGLTQHMDITQILTYATYIIFMTYWVFLKKSKILNYK
jgi:high-affinity iron transporter